MNVVRIIKLFLAKSLVEGVDRKINAIEEEIENLKASLKAQKDSRADYIRARVTLENEILKKESEYEVDLDENTKIVFLNTKGNVAQEVTKRPALLIEGEISEDFSNFFDNINCTK